MSIKQLAERRRKQHPRCLRERKISKRRKRNNYALTDYTTQNCTLQEPKTKTFIVVIYER